MGWSLAQWDGPLIPETPESGKEVPSVLKAEEEIAKWTIATAEAFATIARERLLSPVDLQVCILPTVTRNINREKSEEETDAWLNTLFELIPLLDKEVLKTEVLSLALSKGDVEGVVGSRTICVRILGALAPRLTWEEIERSFFKKALSMCQDVDHHIRIASCGQLASIARIAGRDVVAKTILPELFELLNDEEVQARVASLTTLTSILDMVPPEVRKGQVMPILRNHMQPLELDIAMQRCLARVFGQLVTVVKVDFEHDDSVLFFSCYKHLATKADVELRRLCASQLPAVLRAATALTAAAFSQHFQDTLTNLATDPDAEVRKTIAGQLHEVARVVGKDSPALLTRPLCRLLRDEAPAVQGAMLGSLTQCLAHWVVKDEARREPALAELAKALLELEGGAKRNWRMQQQLAQAFPLFPQVFTSDQVYEHFVPVVFRYLTDSAAAVKPVAAEGVVCFLRYNRREKQRAEILLRLIRDFCRGRAFSSRITFVDIAGHMLRRFSSRFIKDFMFDLVLELLYDPVPNVRLAVTSLLPALKTCIKLPEDVDLLERLNSGMSNIMTDNDRDVSQNARTVNEQFKKTPMRMGGAGGGMLDMNGSMGAGGAGMGFGLGPASAGTEAEDRRREDEEADFTFTQDDLKEVKSEILQVGSAKGGKGGLAPGALAGKSGVQRRPGGLQPVGATYERTSPSMPGGRQAFGTSASQGRRGAAASEDGSGPRAGGMGALGAVRAPSGSGNVVGPGSRIGSAASTSSSGSKGYGLGSPVSLSSAIKTNTGISRITAIPSAVTKPGSPLIGSVPSPPGSSSGAGPGSAFQTGLRLPAITTRSSPTASPPSGLAGKPGSSGGLGAPSRLTGNGPVAAAKTPLTTAGYHEAGNVGLEHAAPDTVRSCLTRARRRFGTERREFSLEELQEAGLVGAWNDKQKVRGSQLRRNRFCRALGIDEVGTGKALLNLLNRFFTREEFREALRAAEEAAADPDAAGAAAHDSA
ncbi:hypothetical protein GPECTOR_35g818 [Gonium pectorale]|uniref:Uncharacterized protein n=1 Tax=Gonium pectorale TaxID=33097 RepID=A0A150GDG4_GONPE|nr:hypothetical protein GPECTOR_35g818 [Gonium pectorale]|eukprot:KXZ47380.1 hypothetical protein GPECTOR_35g818 [Gonium pectorale]